MKAKSSSNPPKAREKFKIQPNLMTCKFFSAMISKRSDIWKELLWMQTTMIEEITLKFNGLENLSLIRF